MGVGRMMGEWRLDIAYPVLARVPTTLPWHIAPLLGRDAASNRASVESFLVDRFGVCFPDASPAQRLNWARLHLDMLAQEMVDALAFHRLGMRGGPSIELQGLEHLNKAQEAGRGVILVLNHVDRLLTAPVALARRGVASNVLTMPVLDNPDINPSLKRFLLTKIEGYTRVTGGIWRTTAETLRPVHSSLRDGGIWIILADAWRPEFGRLRSHPFLSGTLQLPTGVERLAQSTGACLIHAVTRSMGGAHLHVLVEPLPDDPVDAVSAVIQKLAAEVRARPWAWWQWGILDRMWSPS